MKYYPLEKRRKVIERHPLSIVIFCLGIVAIDEELAIQLDLKFLDCQRYYRNLTRKKSKYIKEFYYNQAEINYTKWIFHILVLERKAAILIVDKAGLNTVILDTTSTRRFFPLYQINLKLLIKLLFDIYL
ncbi:hypothetical protein RCL_jg4775.t1 [Rhizophagus clarus]|uniref:Uncharacterized protein n=1 Tax=Rhizophagus clarus TaxID=94130 RepID=A0A8H3MI44_9GLOM|nr:hypothetical protein RCL_jg4775.t1 [Rhizophagus clarus]